MTPDGGIDAGETEYTQAKVLTNDVFMKVAVSPRVQ